MLWFCASSSSSGIFYTPVCNILGSGFGNSNGTFQYTTSLTGLTTSGQALTFYFDASTRTLSPSIDTSDISGSLSLGGTEAFSFSLINFANGTATAELRYGPLFAGIKEVACYFQSNVILGSIDGRVLSPIVTSTSNTTLTFMDGNLAPNVRIAANLTTANLATSLQALQSKIPTNNSCSTLLIPTAALPNMPILTSLRIHQSGLDYSQDPGH